MNGCESVICLLDNIKKLAIRVRETRLACPDNVLVKTWLLLCLPMSRPAPSVANNLDSLQRARVLHDYYVTAQHAWAMSSRRYVMMKKREEEKKIVMLSAEMSQHVSWPKHRATTPNLQREACM